METPFKLTIRVSWGMQLLQILFALLFTVLAIVWLILLVRDQITIPNLIMFLLFVSFAYLGWANALSTIRITESSVTVNVFYGRFRIKWDEVETIVTKGKYIALLGNGKRIVLSLYFAGKNKQKMLQFFHQQCEQRNIRFEKGAEPFPINHHNARVWL